MKKVVIFDFDGTIANTLDIAYLVYEQLSTHYGYKKFTHQEINELKLLTLHERLKKHKVSIYQLPRLVRKTRKILKVLIDQATLFEGIKPLLNTLRALGYQLCIVSSNSTDNIRHFLDQHGLDMFTYIDGSAAYFGKERLLKRRLKKLKIKPTEAIYVGDEVRDIISCNNIGLDVIGVTWGFDDQLLIEAAEPTFVAHDMQTLQDLLTQLKK